MRVRKLALAVGMVSALGGNTALALGLGEIKLKSNLNQPLDAEISLLQTRGLSESEIRVRLAGTEEFERAGVDRSYALNDLRFEVDYSGPNPVVRVSTRTPIREPFLNFLVETRWPSGRLLREYTLLMDLPAFSSTAAQQPVRAAERERQQVQRQEPVTVSRPAPQPVAQPQPAAQPEQQPVEPVEEPAPAQEPAPVEAEQPVYEEPAYEEPMELDSSQSPQAESNVDQAGSVYGPVSSNDTLWEIALQARPSRDMTVQQTMLAIQRLNPQAFINDNINLLKKGAVLRLPSEVEIRALNRGEAVAQVAVQNDSWRAGTGVDDLATGAPLDAREVVESAEVASTVEGRVSLAAPGDNESVTSGSGIGAEDSEALEGELAVTEEELDKSRLESEELRERISELDEEIDTMERLVEVSNEELRAVQQASEQADDAIADAEPVEEPVAEEAEQLEVAADTAEETEAAPQQPERPRVVVQTREEKSIVDHVMDNIYAVGGGLAALLLGLLGFMSWRRKKAEEEELRKLEAEMAQERALADAPEIEDSAEDLVAGGEQLESADDFDLGELGEVETEDPVSEAEIHLSLGQHSEAESKLLLGLQRDGQNVDARLMLLEVYAQQQEITKFDDHYRQLLAVSDGPAIDRAARLRESIAGAPAFEQGEIGELSSESLEALQLDEMSSSFDEPALGDDSASSEFDDGGVGLLDELTMDVDTGAIESSDDAAEGDFSLDLDFDAGDLGADLTANSEPAADAGDFDLGDLGDLGSLDLESDAGDTSAAPQAGGDLDTFELDLDLDADAAPAAEPAAEDNGLDFDLDLEPLAESEPTAAAESSVSDQLDLDSLDLGDIALETTPEEPAVEAPSLDAFEAPAELSLEPTVAESAGDELSLEGDLDLEGSLDLEGGLDLDGIDLDGISLDLPEEGAAAATDVVEQPVAQAPASSSPAAAGSSAELEDLSFNLEGDLDSELNLLEGNDEVSTKLELAQAYLDMGDKDGAKDILAEVVDEGGDEHKGRARELLERIS